MSSFQAGNARTYALVGFVFYLIGVIGLILGAAFVFFNYTYFVMPTSFQGFPFLQVTLVAIFFIVLAILVGLSAWSWSTVKQIEVGRFGAARANCLILGVVGLFFGMLIGGIFFLLAYSELSSVMYRPPTPQRFCIHCGRAVPVDSKFCLNCGKELPA